MEVIPDDTARLDVIPRVLVSGGGREEEGQGDVICEKLDHPLLAL